MNRLRLHPDSAFPLGKSSHPIAYLNQVTQAGFVTQFRKIQGSC